MNRMNNTSRIDLTGTTLGRRLDQQAAPGIARTGSIEYRRHVSASSTLFATPPVDLTTLVIAQEIKRKAQAERQRDVLRDTAYQYDMPVSRERNDERSNGINPSDSDQ